MRCARSAISACLRGPSWSSAFLCVERLAVTSTSASAARTAVVPACRGICDSPGQVRQAGYAPDNDEPPRSLCHHRRRRGAGILTRRPDAVPSARFRPAAGLGARSGDRADRQLTFHDEKVALLRRSPADDLLIYGIDRGGDERQQLLLIDPREARPEPRALTANPAVIHDFGGWSPDGTQFAYAANERDEAHFDVYVQDVASGVRRCVYQGTHIVTVSGFRSDGARLALLHDRGYGDMSLLVLDVASGDVTRIPRRVAGQFPERPLGQRRAHAAGTDRSRRQQLLRLCRLDPETGEVSVVFEAPGRDVEAWAISSDARSAGDGRERSRLCGSARRPGRWRTAGGDRLAARCRRRPGIRRRMVARWRSPWRRRTSRRRCGCGATAPRAPSGDPNRIRRTSSIFELVEWESFDGARIPGWLALPRNRDAGWRTSRGRLGAWRPGGPDPTRISGPTSRCWWRRASPC